MIQMRHSLPLPRNRVWRIVATDCYFLACFVAPRLCWSIIRPSPRSWIGFWAWTLSSTLTVMFISIARDFDYFGWLNRAWPYKITPDRDEATTSRKPIDN